MSNSHYKNVTYRRCPARGLERSLARLAARVTNKLEEKFGVVALRKFGMLTCMDVAGLINEDLRNEVNILTSDSGHIEGTRLLPTAIASLTIYAIWFMAAHGVFQALTVLGGAK